jgi:DNA-binding PadR family transcriptional regulator
MALRHVILTVLTRGRMSGYEITRAFDGALSHFWRATHQQVYRELAALSGDGCVSHDVVEQLGRPDKKVYSLTEVGREELRRWVEAPTDQPPPRYDLLVKLLAAPAVDKPALRNEIARVRAVTAGILHQLDAMRRECLRQPVQDMPEYDKTLYLALRRGLLLVEAQLAWLDEVTEFLDSGGLRR